MAHLIVAGYRDRGGAEGALQALLTSGLARDRIGLIGAETRPETELAPLRERPAGQAEGRLRDLPLSPGEIATFEASLSRGHVLLTVRVDEPNLDKARDILDLFDPVDVDQGTAAASGPGSAGGLGGIDVGGPLGAGLSAGALGGATNTAAVPGMAAMAESLDDSGASDQRTRERAPGEMGSSTLPTGDRRADERAGAPGVNELAAAPDLFRRDTARSRGRVRVFTRAG